MSSRHPEEPPAKKPREEEAPQQQGEEEEAQQQGGEEEAQQQGEEEEELQQEEEEKGVEEQSCTDEKEQETSRIFPDVCNETSSQNVRHLIRLPALFCHFLFPTVLVAC